MSDERRFSEAEMARILEHAIATQELEQDLRNGGIAGAQGARAMEPGQGLTLRQLQEIGTEVGIAPEFMARAATSVARGEGVRSSQHRWLGLPIAVSRTIEFDRVISDAEWERMVVALRETFQARGQMQQNGSFRQWTNGNLQALLEPTAMGHRLRLITRKSDVKMLMVLGIALLGAAAGTAGLGALTSSSDHVASLFVPGMLAVMGLFSILPTTLKLPSWARTRASQMERIATSTAQIAP